MNEPIEVGFQAFVSDAQEEFGAIRGMVPNRRELMVYVENGGDFVVSMDAIVKVAFGKVIFDRNKLDSKLRSAIGHAHDSESE